MREELHYQPAHCQRRKRREYRRRKVRPMAAAAAAAAATAAAAGTAAAAAQVSPRRRLAAAQEPGVVEYLAVCASRRGGPSGWPGRTVPRLRRRRRPRQRHASDEERHKDHQVEDEHLAHELGFLGALGRRGCAWSKPWSKGDPHGTPKGQSTKHNLRTGNAIMKYQVK